MSVAGVEIGNYVEVVAASAGLAAIGLDASHIHTEPFGPAPGLTPGIVSAPARAPHPPAGAPGRGPTIEGPMQELLMLCSGRAADGALISGDGRELIPASSAR